MATVNAPAAEFWTTDALPAPRQFTAWRDVIVDAHLSWDIPDIGCERFPAYMRQHRVGAMRLTDCSAAARVSGRRTRTQLAHDDDAYLNLVLIAEGSEALAFGHDDRHRVRLDAGMFTLWDSTRPMAFTTDAGLRQISLIVPEAELLRRVPRVRDLIGVAMDGRSGLGGLFVDHFGALVQRFGELPQAARGGVLEAALDLLGLCLCEQPALPAPRLRQLLHAEALRYIEAHLNEATLGVASIARHLRMTERNVHRLFEAGETSVSALIRRRRLAMCRRDLEGSTFAARQITEIAGHWGFDDPSQFSKAFRAAYGMPARECRARAQALRQRPEDDQHTVPG
ncbi:MAG TPA: helix-turn-helix domain-containing protein [Burkholderiaceae bacterium]|jgi:AraC-like DNA-binding protein